MALYSLKTCKYCEILKSEKWYITKPKPTTGTKGVSILWDLAIQTDGKIKRSRSVITFKDYKRKTRLLNDMSVPTGNKISDQEFNKINKFKDRKKLFKWGSLNYQHVNNSGSPGYDQERDRNGRKNKKYPKRTRRLLETKISERNLIKGIHTWTVPWV